MKRSLFCLLLLSHALNAHEWFVGANRSYTSPSKVSALVQSGDTVSIDAGVYTKDVCSWTKSNLLLRGVGGRAELRSQDTVAFGKAIWVLSGDNVRIEHLAFFDARCPDKNGAGIRFEGHNLAVEDCLFRNNEDGILCGKLHPCTIRIEHCEFDANGAGDGYSHNLYIGNIDTLIFRFNYSHHARIGHEFKSRADVNLISYNRISNEADGTASRCIDLPNGGIAYIVGNIVQQGPKTENSNIAEFGLEGRSQRVANMLFVAHNTFVNNRTQGGSFWQLCDSCNEVRCENNIVCGPGTWLINTNTVAKLIQNANLFSVVDTPFQFLSSASYDYQINSASAARNTGDKASLVELQADMEYVHPCNARLRCLDSTADIGAYEYCGTTEVANSDENSELLSPLNIFPNPCYDQLRFTTAQDLVVLRDMAGRELLRATKTEHLNLRDLAPGLYLLQTETRFARILHL